MECAWVKGSKGDGMGGCREATSEAAMKYVSKVQEQIVFERIRWLFRVRMRKKSRW